MSAPISMYYLWSIWVDISKLDIILRNSQGIESKLSAQSFHRMVPGFVGTIHCSVPDITGSSSAGRDFFEGWWNLRAVAPPEPGTATDFPPWNPLSGATKLDEPCGNELELVHPAICASWTGCWDPGNKYQGGENVEINVSSCVLVFSQTCWTSWDRNQVWSTLWSLDCRLWQLEDLGPVVFICGQRPDHGLDGQKAWSGGQIPLCAHLFGRLLFLCRTHGLCHVHRAGCGGLDHQYCLYCPLCHLQDEGPGLDLPSEILGEQTESRWIRSLDMCKLFQKDQFPKICPTLFSNAANNVGKGPAEHHRFRAAVDCHHNRW